MSDVIVFPEHEDKDSVDTSIAIDESDVARLAISKTIDDLGIEHTEDNEIILAVLCAKFYKAGRQEAALRTA